MMDKRVNEAEEEKQKILEGGTLIYLRCEGKEKTERCLRNGKEERFKSSLTDNFDLNRTGD